MAATNDRGNSYHTLGTNSSPDYFLEPWLESHWTSAHFTTLSSGDPNGDAPIYRHAAAAGRGFGTFKGVVDTELFAYGIPGRVRREEHPAAQFESYFNVSRYTVKQSLLLRPEEQVLTPQKLGASYARKLARWWTPYEERWAFRTMSAGGFTFATLTTDVPYTSYTDAQLIATMEEAFTSTTTFESESGVGVAAYGEGSTGACAVFCSDGDPGYVVGVTADTYATMNETNGINPKAVGACAARLRNRGVAPPALNPQSGMPSAGRGYILFVEANGFYALTHHEDWETRDTYSGVRGLNNMFWKGRDNEVAMIDGNLVINTSFPNANSHMYTQRTPLRCEVIDCNGSDNYVKVEGFMVGANCLCQVPYSETVDVDTWLVDGATPRTAEQYFGIWINTGFGLIKNAQIDSAKTAVEDIDRHAHFFYTAPIV